MAINSLMESGATMDQQNLTDELHVCIKKMCENGLLKHMNSCHKETLEAAFGRFSELGLCYSQVY